jgi:hypothetical protein
MPNLVIRKSRETIVTPSSAQITSKYCNRHHGWAITKILPPSKSTIKSNDHEIA